MDRGSAFARSHHSARCVGGCLYRVALCPRAENNQDARPRVGVVFPPAKRQHRRFARCFHDAFDLAQALLLAQNPLTDAQALPSEVLTCRIGSVKMFPATLGCDIIPLFLDSAILIIRSLGRDLIRWPGQFVRLDDRHHSRQNLVHHAGSTPRHAGHRWPEFRCFTNPSL